MKIYFDKDYPKTIYELFKKIHDLKGNDKYEIHLWDNVDIKESDLNDSIFLVIDYTDRGISIPYQKLYEDGYKTFVCKAGKATAFSRFGLALTLFTVWPSILEKSEAVRENFLYTFKYGGKKLSAKKIN